MRNFRNTHSWKIKVVKERHKVKKVQFVLSLKEKKKGLSNQISFTKGLCTKESRSEYKNN